MTLREPDPMPDKSGRSVLALSPGPLSQAVRRALT